MFSVILDTCVLWPSLQRDFLLSLGIEGLYRPLWSSAILEELEMHEALKLKRRGSAPLAAQRAARHLIAQMSGAFDDACVQGWESLDGSYGLPDPDDEHLVAAAVVGGAGAIVTLNARDLPEDLVPARIQVKSPADFALETVEIAPNLALVAVAQMAARRRRPAQDIDELLATMEKRYGMSAAVAVLRDAAA
jgi:predicted nucleic acid-binding protein